MLSVSKFLSTRTTGKRLLCGMALSALLGRKFARSSGLFGAQLQVQRHRKQPIALGPGQR